MQQVGVHVEAPSKEKKLVDEEVNGGPTKNRIYFALNVQEGVEKGLRQFTSEHSGPPQ